MTNPIQGITSSQPQETQSFQVGGGDNSTSSETMSDAFASQFAQMKLNGDDQRALLTAALDDLKLNPTHANLSTVQAITAQNSVEIGTANAFANKFQQGITKVVTGQ